MSHLVNSISNLGRRSDYLTMNSGWFSKLNPLLKYSAKLDLGTQNAVLGSPNPGTRYYGEATPPPPGPATQDTAANATLQQQLLLRRRRGVLGNIYAGGNAGSPQTATKSALGG
jgi:hypothetical protein